MHTVYFYHTHAVTADWRITYVFYVTEVRRESFDQTTTTHSAGGEKESRWQSFEDTTRTHQHISIFETSNVYCVTRFI